MACSRPVGNRSGWSTFPMFEFDEGEQRWVAAHHPFTAPKDGHEDFLETDPGRCLAKAYDLALNGWEIGGGSVRIHREDVQSKVFRALKIGAEEARAKFGFLLDALAVRRAPAWRAGVWSGPHRHDDGRRRIHSRCHRLSQDAACPVPADAGAGAGGRAAVARAAHPRSPGRTQDRLMVGSDGGFASPPRTAGTAPTLPTKAMKAAPMKTLRLRVATYNIHKGVTAFGRRSRVSELRMALHRIDADIVFLQEVQDRNERRAGRGVGRTVALEPARRVGLQRLRAPRLRGKRGLSAWPPRQRDPVAPAHRAFRQPRHLRPHARAPRHAARGGPDARRRPDPSDLRAFRPGQAQPHASGRLGGATSSSARFRWRRR
jgi:hypothetical protein